MSLCIREWTNKLYIHIQMKPHLTLLRFNIKTVKPKLYETNFLAYLESHFGVPRTNNARCFTTPWRKNISVFFTLRQTPAINLIFLGHKVKRSVRQVINDTLDHNSIVSSNILNYLTLCDSTLCLSTKGIR